MAAACPSCRSEPSGCLRCPHGSAVCVPGACNRRLFHARSVRVGRLCCRAEAGGKVAFRHEAAAQPMYLGLPWAACRAAGGGGAAVRRLGGIGACVGFGKWVRGRGGGVCAATGACGTLVVERGDSLPPFQAAIKKPPGLATGRYESESVEFSKGERVNQWSISAPALLLLPARAGGLHRPHS